MKPLLQLDRLTVSIGDSTIIDTFSLTLEPGSVHGIMGPNGSGKSTLANVISGHPRYTVREGDIVYDGSSVRELSPDKRAQRGMFVSFQHAPEIPGIPILTFLKEAHRACTGVDIDLDAFHEQVCAYADLVGLKREMLERTVNDKFSGGEKKRFELLQVLLLKPRLTIFDEIDSGLDVDALKVVATVINTIRSEKPLSCFVIITHYNRLWQYIRPDYVHIMMGGRLVQSGSAALADSIQAQGYQQHAL